MKPEQHDFTHSFDAQRNEGLSAREKEDRELAKIFMGRVNLLKDIVEESGYLSGFVLQIGLPESQTLISLAQENLTGTVSRVAKGLQKNECTTIRKVGRDMLKFSTATGQPPVFVRREEVSPVASETQEEKFLLEAYKWSLNEGLNAIDHRKRSWLKWIEPIPAEEGGAPAEARSMVVLAGFYTFYIAIPSERRFQEIAGMGVTGLNNAYDILQGKSPKNNSRIPEPIHIPPLHPL